MADHQDRIDQLNLKLETLLKKQEGFANELMLLYQELEKIKKLEPEQLTSTVQKPIAEVDKQIESITKPQPKVEEVKQVIEAPKKARVPKIKKPKGKSNWEKFIGENLINKIGIAILIIGVAIGAKYSIDNGLISPLTRIILGYLVGLGLIGFGFKLKTKYENYSAVLVSGALTVLYFITFIAYDFYLLFPQLMAFGLMLIFTVFGVVAALNYNKQIIAHIGLVGAYAVPFLLSNGSGNVIALFSYVTIINIGILVISFKKYWKPLFYSAFTFTWLIYAAFVFTTYVEEDHFQIALLFISVSFIVFYITFLAYKLKGNEQFKKSDIVLVLLNSFIFYGFGFFLLAENTVGSELLGVFTLINAIIHFSATFIIYKKKLADRNLFYLVSGMVLIFITLAIPVQLDGNWVTLLWILEAALLFWIGRTKNVNIYERISYPLMIMAFISLIQDWSYSYLDLYYIDEAYYFTSILNISFLSSIVFVIAMSFINFTHYKSNTIVEPEGRKKHWLAKIMNYGMPIILILALYGSFFYEIEFYWSKLFEKSRIESEDYYSIYNYYLSDFKVIWLNNYTFLFLSGLVFFNLKKIKNRTLGIATIAIGLITTLIFLSGSLYILSELRESYILRDLPENNFEVSALNIGIRYIIFGFFALFLFALHKLMRSEFMKIDTKIPFGILMHVSTLWILSSELLHWLDLFGSEETYKLGLSILWGLYSLMLIALGIWKKKKYLRIGAIILFTITLIKLFAYDIASMNTITKTIVFVSLGVLLLIISFLYNKYKHIIADETEK